jgi:hypothetical protein
LFFLWKKMFNVEQAYKLNDKPFGFRYLKKIL